MPSDDSSGCLTGLREGQIYCPLDGGVCTTPSDRHFCEDMRRHAESNPLKRSTS